MPVRARFLPLLILASCGGGSDDFTYTGAPAQVVALDLSGELPQTTTNVNGMGSYSFVCDSGSPITILDAPSFPGLSDGKHTDDLGAFGMIFTQYQDASWDFSGSGTPGILGGDLLRHFAFSIDYQGARGFLSDPFDPAQIPLDVSTNPAVLVPFQLAGGGLSSLPGNCSGGCGTMQLPATRVLLRATFEGQTDPVYVIIDSGATAVVLDETLYSALGDTARRPVLDGIQVSGVNGVMDAFYTRVWQLTLDGVNAGDPTVSLLNVPAFVVPGSTLLQGVSQEVGVDVKALVGGMFLRNYFVTIDYPNQQLRLAQYTDESHIDPDEFVSAGFTLVADGTDWKVSSIYPSSDAYAQGIRAGDIIDDLDNMPIAGQPAAAVNEILANHTVGSHMAVDVAGVPELMVSVLIENFLPDYPPPP